MCILISEVSTSYYIVICHHLNEYNKKRGWYLTFSSLFILFCILVYSLQLGVSQHLSPGGVSSFVRIHTPRRVPVASPQS